ncbi:hypothetical protein AAFF_G00106150 [Aldrovandia affinis]|uniref:Uncharacterized protein n=1 Tax=Aldrovandia affinis TaxID=143900 RepID=A0AAD7T2A1_9TELE|nr:hypothetical protein AAFF_G00106150 [Aldrovandia affinis]
MFDKHPETCSLLQEGPPFHWRMEGSADLQVFAWPDEGGPIVRVCISAINRSGKGKEGSSENPRTSVGDYGGGAVSGRWKTRALIEAGQGELMRVKSGLREETLTLVSSDYTFNRFNRSRVFPLGPKASQVRS